MEILIGALLLAAWLGSRFMGVVSARSGVLLNGLAPEGIRILGSLDHASRAFDVDLVITSAVRPEDSDSMHSLGKAIDVRTSNLTEAQIDALYHWLASDLGPSYVVLFETPSINSVPVSLRPIATVNPAATGVHFHLGVRRT